MPYLFGLAVDIGGNYRGGFLLVSGVALMGTVSIGLFRQYKVR